MTAALHSDRECTLAGIRARVRVWGDSESLVDLVICTLPTDTTSLTDWDIYAIAGAARSHYGTAQLVLDTGGDLFEVAETSDGGWTTAPVSLSELAADLGVDPSEVLP